MLMTIPTWKTCKPTRHINNLTMFYCFLFFVCLFSFFLFLIDRVIKTIISFQMEAFSLPDELKMCKHTLLCSRSARGGEAFPLVLPLSLITSDYCLLEGEMTSPVLIIIKPPRECADALASKHAWIIPHVCAAYCCVLVQILPASNSYSFLNS